MAGGDEKEEDDDDGIDGATDGTPFFIVTMMGLLLAAGAAGTRVAGRGIGAVGEEDAEEGREVPSLTTAA